MASITLEGNPVHTIGELPAIGSSAPDFSLANTDLSDVSLGDFSGIRVLNIFPSIDTPVCAASVRKFNEDAGGIDGVNVLCISADLPFAHARFCGAEGLDKVVSLSTFRSADFGKQYGVEITDGPLTGIMSRAIVIVDGDGKVIYTEQVPEIAQEPDYAAALATIK
jgi:thiol peroxidase